MKKTPIAVFAYNRPTHLQITLEALSSCSRLDDCDIFIYCDGIKNHNDFEKIEKTRKIAADWANQYDANVILREENFGIKKSIIDGVTRACEKFGRVIVIEDDIVVGPLFIDFMLSALDHYEKESKVYQVAGFLFSSERLSKEDVFIIPLISSWGWATWKRAWDGCDFEIKNAPISLKNKAFRKKFDLDGTQPWSKMLEDEYNHHIDTWDIQFYYHVFINNGLVVYPSHTLVYNSGFDSTGVHCGNFDVNPISKTDLLFIKNHEKFRFPKNVLVNQKIFTKHKMSIRKMYKVNKFKSFVSKIKHKIKKFF